MGGPMCPTSHLSNLIDIQIKPLVAFVKSNLRDSTEFINKLPHTVPIETIMTTFNVISIYTNIPHNLGSLMVYPDSIPSRFSRPFVLEGIRLILNNNTIFFDDKLLLQKKGTAMGTEMVPSFPTLVLGYLEKQMYQKAVTEFGKEMDSYVESHWFRNLDDCCISWVFGEEYLKEFHEFLNSLNSKYKVHN